MKDRYLIFLIILFLLSNLLNTYLSYQEIIIGFIMYIPIILFYSIIIKKHNKDIYDIIDNKIISKILIFLYIAIYSYILLVTINEYIIFMKNSNVINTPSILVLISLIIMGIYGLKNIYKLSQSLLFITSIVLIILLIINVNIRFKNMLPIINNISINGFYKYLEMFFIIHYMKEVKKPLKTSLLGTFIAFLIYLVLNLYIMFIIGESLSSIIRYPFYNAVALIDYLTFISRIESVTIVVLLSSILAKMIICLNLIMEGLKRLRINNKIIYGILIFIMSFGMIMSVRINDIYFIIPGIIIPLFLFFKRKKTL